MSKVSGLLSSWPLRFVAALVLVPLGVLCILDSERVADETYYTAINDRAIELIDETLDRDMVTFLVITGIKTTLAMIEGSTVGIGFEIQVGDIVQPAYDYVDFFWRAFLYAFMVLGFYKLLLETDLLLLGIVVVGIGFVLFGVGIIGRTPHIDLRRWGRRCVLIGILVAYVTPLSLIMTELLSDRYTSTIKEKHAETIDGFHSEVEASALEFLALKDQISILQPGKTLDDLQTGMLRIVTSIGKTFRLSLLAFLYYVLILLFELLFFPLLSAVILYKFTVFALGRVFDAPRPPAPTPVHPPATL